MTNRGLITCNARFDLIFDRDAEDDLFDIPSASNTANPGHFRYFEMCINRATVHAKESPKDYQAALENVSEEPLHIGDDTRVWSEIRLPAVRLFCVK